MPEPHLRAADSDRAAVAAALGQHMSAGRLTLDEYDERLTRVYAAKTYGELDQLTADLPRTGRERTPVRAQSPASTPSHAPAQCTPAGAAMCAPGGVQSSWRAWASTAFIVLAIWAVTSIGSSEFLYFWPIWVIGPWGAVLLARTISGGGDRRRPRDGHRQFG
jgi:Domain of unknown function (DUF1707)